MALVLLQKVSKIPPKISSTLEGNRGINHGEKNCCILLVMLKASCCSVTTITCGSRISVHFTKVGSSSFAVVIFVFGIYDLFCEWLMISFATCRF